MGFQNKSQMTQDTASPDLLAPYKLLYISLQTADYHISLIIPNGADINAYQTEGRGPAFWQTIPSFRRHNRDGIFAPQSAFKPPGNMYLSKNTPAKRRSHQTHTHTHTHTHTPKPSPSKTRQQVFGKLKTCITDVRRPTTENSDPVVDTS